MKIVTTFHQPSSVVCSVKCQLSSRDLEHLVVARIHKIDVYSLQPEGLHHQCSLEIQGSIVSMKSIPIPGSSRSNLLVLLGHPEPELLFLTCSEDSFGNTQLIAKKQLSLYERSSRHAEFFTGLIVHPSGKMAISSVYVGKLRIVTFKSGNYDQDFDVMIRELNVLGLIFLLLPEDEYTIAMLSVVHVDRQLCIQLLCRDIILGDSPDISHTPSTILSPTIIPSKVLSIPDDSGAPIPTILPVPPQIQDTDDHDDDFMGGVLVIGGKKILLYELANEQSQAKQKSKRRRLETKKNSIDAAEAEGAIEKELERETRSRKVQGSVDWPWSDVLSVCVIDPLMPRYILSDYYGRLSMLSLERFKEQNMILLPLGEASPATTLTHLTSQTFYLGSHFGDSQLLQILSTPSSFLTSPTLPIPPEIQPVPPSRLFHIPNNGKGKGKDVQDDNSRDFTKGAVIATNGSYINVIENIQNIAPIVDAILVDIDDGGEQQIVTCSGGGNKGSLNIVRNGADFQELGFVPGLSHVTSVWGVRDEFEDTFDSHILVSTLEETFLFRINDVDGTLSHISATGLHERSGLITDCPTLAFGNVAQRVNDASGKGSYENSQLVVQVTRKGVFLFEYNILSKSYLRLDEYEEAGSDIVTSNVNPSQIVLALSGGRLVALAVMQRNFRVIVKDYPSDHRQEISTVSCVPLDRTRLFSTYITVSYWGTNIIEVLALSKGSLISVSKSPPLHALIRSALLFNVGSDVTSSGTEYQPFVFAGLSDGSVMYFSWKEKKLDDCKLISLGNAPVSVTICQVDRKSTVVAAGSRATVFSWDKKRLHTSPLIIKDVVAVSHLNTSTFSSSLILATPSGLTIGRVKDLGKLHIRSIPMGLDNPRRVVYQPHLNALGIGIMRTEPTRIGELALFQSAFRLVDHTTFTTLANFKCAQGEEISTITTYSPVIDGKPMPVFVVGAFIPDGTEPKQGRILVLSTYSNNTTANATCLQLSLIASADVHGCVYSLGIINDIVVAAVNSSVMLFRLRSLDGLSTPSFGFELLSEWNHNYVVSSLASYEDHIIAGDILCSISLLKVSAGKLQTVAKDYGPVSPVCVEASDQENILVANTTSNLLTFTLARTLDRSRLERNGHYYLGDNVTKFLRGSLALDRANTANFSAQHLFFTASGRIGVILDVIDSQLALHLTALQRNLAEVIHCVGGTSHAKFRAPKNERGRSDAEQESRGFLDGDFLEQFLTRLGSPDDINKIMAGQSEPERLTISVEEMQRVLETLQSMH